MADETEAVGNQFAVVATGYISPDYEAIPFKTDAGQVCPVVIKLCRDREDAEKFRKRLLTRHSRIGGFKADKWVACTPIYGIAETDLKALPKRQGNPNAFGRGAKPAEGTAPAGGNRRKGGK